MAYGKHRYRISIKSNVDEVREFLDKNKLIVGVEGNPVANMTSDIVNIVVIVRNKRNFESWYSDKKYFRESTDPIELDYIVGKPVELPDIGGLHKKPSSRKIPKEEDFKKMKGKYDFRK